MRTPGRARVPGGRRRAVHVAVLLVAVLLAAGLAPGGATAALTARDLKALALAPAIGATIPADIMLRDLETQRSRSLGGWTEGRATILLPVDYECKNVCDATLAATGAALAGAGLDPDAYRLILVGLRPGSPAAAATRMAEGALGTARRAVVAEADTTTVSRLAQAIGYGYRYDEAIDQYAHPAGGVLLAADGRIARALLPLSLTPRDLRLALIEAGENRYATLADRITLICYGADPATGIYTPLIRRILSMAALATVAAIAAGLVLLSRRPRADS